MILSFGASRLQATPFIYSQWWPPTDAFTNDAQYQLMKDLGFNFVVTNWQLGSPAQNQKILQLAAAKGMKVFVYDGRIDSAFVKAAAGDLGYQAIVDSILADYQSDPAYAGLLLKDEPSDADLAGWAVIYQYVLARDPSHLPLINLFGIVPPATLGAPTYEQYVNDFITTVHPKILMYDHYPLLAPAGETDTYFENLEIARRQALNAGIRFTEFTQAMAFGTTWRQPSEPDLRWENFTALAYGVRGLLYFCYFPPKEFVPPKPAIVDSQGVPTAEYAWIQGLNSRLRTLMSTYDQLHSVDVIHTGLLPLGTHGLAAGQPLVSAAGDPLVVGWLKDNLGRDFLMVANRSTTVAANAGLALGNAYTFVSEISQTTGQPIPVLLSGSTLNLSLAPGDGKLFRLETGPVPAPTVQLTNLTRPGHDTDFFIGDQFRVTVTGPANQLVSLSLTHDGVPSGPATLGQTDGSGVFTVTGTQAPSTIGAWVETWSVAGAQAAPVIQFQVMSGTPNVVVSKVPSANTAKSGDKITFTLTYENRGGSDALGTIVSDAIPAGTLYVAGSAAPPANFDGTQLQWNLGTIGPNETGSVRFEVQVK